MVMQGTWWFWFCFNEVLWIVGGFSSVESSALLQ